MTGPETTTVPATGTPLQVLKLLADDTRWRLLHELRRSDYQVGELVERLKLPQNLVSYHLGLLRQAGLVQVHRSDADARALYYSLDLHALHEGYQQIGAALNLPHSAAPQMLPALPVLFLCTGNSARSQMAEGWLRHLSGGRVPVRSAGVHPRELHPLAIAAMAEAGIDIGYQHAKGMDAVSTMQPGVVVTVCDRAREECAPCADAPVQIHWSVPDPVSPENDIATFRAVRDQLRQRVEALVGLLPGLKE